MSMYFPLGFDPPEQDCYYILISLLHPNGLFCPNGHSLTDCSIYKRNRAPIIDYRCKICGKCFNIFTETVLKGTKYKVTQIIHFIDGITRKIPIAKFSREMKVDRKRLKIFCEKLKAISPAITDHNSRPDWLILLKNIVDWKIEDDQEYNGPKCLIVKIKNGKSYKLTHMTGEKIIDSKINQSFSIIGTKVEKVTKYIK